MCFEQNELIKVQFFRLLSALMKVHSIPHATFETTRSGFIQILHHVQCHERKLLCIFVAQTLFTLDKKKFSDFWVVEWKPTKSLMSYLTKSQFFFKHFAPVFSIMRDNSSSHFLAKTLYYLDKRSPSKGKISDFWLLTWNFTKFVLWLAPFFESM